MVGSRWPVPTWNLPTVRQSVQAAGMLLPAELSASIRVGATRLAMMSDQSLYKRGKWESIRFFAYAAMANAVRLAFFASRVGSPKGVPSRKVA